MSTAPSEIWNNILKGNVEKDDPLWKEYLDKAAVSDARMVDEWNKIVDVLLVYVALFISVLTAFIIQTFTQFQRNPADITNDLLVAIYNQLAAQSNNTSVPHVDPRSYFNQPKDDYDAAVTQNALLFTSLSLSIIVSVIALVAKLWLVSYSRQTSSVGSPYERAMKRQEAYTGVLVWNLGGVINLLPVILLVALFLFEIFVFLSVVAVQTYIGLAVSAVLNVGVLFLGFTSLGGAIIPGCPFRSSFSDTIRLIFTLPKRILLKCVLFLRCEHRCILLFTPQSDLSRMAVVPIATLIFGAMIWSTLPLIIISSRNDAGFSTIWISLYLFPVTVLFAFSSQRKVAHKPQKYNISHMALWAFLFYSLLTMLGVFGIPLIGSEVYGGGSLYEFLFVLMILLGGALTLWSVSISMVDTGEIDAIAWLLTTSPPQYPATFFKKASQMTGDDSIGRHYRPRLLESLMPFLTLLITSHHVPENPSSDTHSPSSIDEDRHFKNLEIYVACLARLSEFTDSGGSFWCLWENARQHLKLEQPLIDKLVELADPRHRSDHDLPVRSAAIKVLNNYKLDSEGNALCRVTVVRGVGTGLMSAASLMLGVREPLNTQASQDAEEQGLPNFHTPVELATRIEPPHSIEENEEAELRPETLG